MSQDYICSLCGLDLYIGLRYLFSLRPRFQHGDPVTLTALTVVIGTPALKCEDKDKQMFDKPTSGIEMFLEMVFVIEV